MAEQKAVGQSGWCCGLDTHIIYFRAFYFCLILIWSQDFWFPELAPLDLNQRRLFIDLNLVSFFKQKGLNVSMGVWKYGKCDVIFHEHKNQDMNNELSNLIWRMLSLPMVGGVGTGRSLRSFPTQTTL